MPHPQPLTSRLDRLRVGLARHRARTDSGEGPLIWAAVAVVLVPQPDALLLIRRAERTGDPWSGHMALPGGRQDPGDPDLTATAVRETAEEVGVELPRAALLGSLDDVVPRTPALPPIAVRPYVFALPERPPLSLNPEVASARWVLLDHLLHPRTYHSVRIQIRGEDREFPAYQLEDAIVWGMTERVVTTLLDR
ncbi:MAG TPA: CoA pyrophosphatase, partial [Gemmatimonadales bacterium]|nr:CoA pyrophosphatase [Gemmatimonadales bacterium]